LTENIFWFTPVHVDTVKHKYSEHGYSEFTVIAKWNQPILYHFNSRIRTITLGVNFLHSGYSGLSKYLVLVWLW
jgi:hypothetical protein